MNPTTMYNWNISGCKLHVTTGSRTLRTKRFRSHSYKLHTQRPPAHQIQLINGAVAVDQALTLEHAALQIIKAAAEGKVAPEQAAREVAQLSASKAQAGGDAATQRSPGLPEIVCGTGRSADQVGSMLQSLMQSQRKAIATRIEPEMYSAVRKIVPGVEYNARARLLTATSPTADKLPKCERLPGSVAVVSASCTDLGAAEECRIIAEHLGCFCFKLTDMGTGGIQKVMNSLTALRAADVVIVVAGMDGALPSIIAGIVDAPVIAVPTSAGAGAAFGGVVPLLACLNSSSPGVSVVNIDNGHGAAMVAARTLRAAARLHAKMTATAASAATAATAAPPGASDGAAGNGKPHGAPQK